MNPSDTRPIQSTGAIARNGPLQDAAPSGPRGAVIGGAAQRLASHRLASRWLERAPNGARSSLAYRLATMPEDAEHRLDAPCRFVHPHALPIERFDRRADGAVWLTSPFPGSYDGLLTLSALLTRKPGGQLDPWESRHAINHLLAALEAGRAAGLAHGVVRPDEVVVDRRGSVRIELFGVGAALAGEVPDETSEVRSVVRIARELLTGVAGDAVRRAPRIPGPMGPAWRRWFDAAPGLKRCADARAALLA